MPKRKKRLLSYRLPKLQPESFSLEKSRPSIAAHISGTPEIKPQQAPTTKKKAKTPSAAPPDSKASSFPTYNTHHTHTVHKHKEDGLYRLLASLGASLIATSIVAIFLYFALSLGPFFIAALSLASFVAFSILTYSALESS